MDNPGTRNLGDVALAAINAATSSTVITSAPDTTGQTVAYLDDLDGMMACTLEANFVYGSGGTSVKLVVETTVNQGTTWTEVWRAAFAAASEENLVNLSGLTGIGSPYVPVALADDATRDGIFGSRWRARIITTGTYGGNTSLSVRMNAR